MRTNKVLAGLAVAVFSAGVALSTGIARAGDDKPDGMPSMPVRQKVVKTPYTDSLLGTWSTEGSSPMGTNKGTATYRLGAGGTAILEDYESTGKNPDGTEMKFSGHGIHKVSDDGKTITVWWIDVHSAEPIKLSGALTDKGYDISGDTPQGKLHLTMQKTPEGHAFTMEINGMSMTEAYKPAPR